jgi:hypothetical protein
MGKLWSKTLNQECHIVNHCLPAWILGWYVEPAIVDFPAISCIGATSTAEKS